MCGRFVLRHPRHPWLDGMGPELGRARYNISPSQAIPAVGRDAEGQRRVQSATWGFRPRWLDERRKAPINARAETAATTPMFRRAFAHGRCLIPADGWYEWQAQESGPRQPYFFQRPGAERFWFAGLAARDGEGHLTAAILTVEANEAARAIHPRMPLVLAGDERAAGWLDPHADVAGLAELLRPPAADVIEIRAVSRRVNRPENDVPECIAAAG